MPPIAGVVQGAMVLQDTVFLDLDHERLEQVLKPKVDGSLHLDELFSSKPDRPPLDFFVFLSSLAYIVGNPGQTAYTAANAFMASLAADRRRRGLAASVLNLAGIKGEGYVARRLTTEKELALQKGGFPFMPLRAFHEAFAESVLASPVDGGSGSGESFEISTMMRGPNGEGVGDGKAFSSNPIFQHLVTRVKSTLNKGSATLGRSQPLRHSVRDQLELAESKEEIQRIIRGMSPIKRPRTKFYEPPKVFSSLVANEIAIIRRTICKTLIVSSADWR